MKILIKISGESLAGGHDDGRKYDEPTVLRIRDQIRTLYAAAHSIAIVVGGGNIFRGKDLMRELSILPQATADNAGMLATVPNALVLRDALQNANVDTRVMSAIRIDQVCEWFIGQRARHHMRENRVVILCGGLGVPNLTTDTTAVLRAKELDMDMVIMTKNRVAGIYTADPNVDPAATFLPSITASEFLAKNLKIADQTAVAFARENKVKIKIVPSDALKDALNPAVGSVIVPE